MSNVETDNFPIYLDFAASTPCDPKVVEAMLPYLTNNCANSSNLSHVFGIKAYDAIEYARQQASNLIGSLADEIIWTSSATESNNLAIKGVAKASLPNKRHIITALNEHKSVISSFRSLEKEGFPVTYLKPDKSGCITADILAKAIRDDTFFISIMAANNELGTINNIDELSQICKRENIIFHSDATQWIGKMSTTFLRDKVDLLSWSAHKIYGPKGVGGLFVRSISPKINIVPLLSGGGHEKGLRSGSLNVPGIIGFGVACKICEERMETDSLNFTYLRDYLESSLISAIPCTVINGKSANRVPHITNVTFHFKNNMNLVNQLTKIACSSGSACGTGGSSPSHVLRSIGIPPKQAGNTLRLSIGRETTKEQIEVATENIIQTINTINQ